MFNPDIKLGLVEGTREGNPRERREVTQARIKASIYNIWGDFYDGKIDEPSRIQRMGEYIKGLSEEDQSWLDEKVGFKGGKMITRAMEIATGIIDEARLETYPDGVPPSVAKATRKQKSRIRKS
jgi:hypothetical protein